MTQIQRSELDALVANPDAYRMEAITAAIAQLDEARSLRLLFARIKSGASVPIEAVADLFPLLDNPTDGLMLIAAADGRRTETLIALLERSAVAEDSIGRELRAVAIFMAWKLRGELDVRAVLAQNARYAVWRRNRAAEGSGLISAIEGELNDDVLASLVREARRFSTLSGVPIAVAASAIQADRDTVVRYAETLDPNQPLARVVTSLALAGARVGRNEPCPCGSGQKFKRCHGDQDAGPRASGISADAPRPKVPTPTPRTPEAAQTVALSELVKNDPRRLSSVVVSAAVERLMKYRLWPHAERFLRDLVSRPEIDRVNRQSLSMTLAFEAVMCAEYGVAARWLEKTPEDYAGCAKPAALAAIAIGTHAPDALERLLAVLDLVVRDDTGAAATSLASLVWRSCPSLTILLVRC